MSLGRGRVRRPDDWPSSHVRARADLSDRLDDALDPTEADWLASHLGACPDCRLIADAYAAQRLELRALRDRTPPPPRDLWARTVAAIESESTFRDGRARSAGWRNRRNLAPSAVIASVLVVAVAAGLLTSSQHPGDVGNAGPTNQVAVLPPSVGTPGGSLPGPTPIPVAKKIVWVAVGSDGNFSVNTQAVNQVCPATATAPCSDTNAAHEQPVKLDQNASTVFGDASGKRLIVINDPSSGTSGTISVVPLASEAPGLTPEPSGSPSVSPSAVAASVTPSTGPTATPRPTPSAIPPSTPPSAPPSASETPSATVDGSPSPSPSVEVTATPSGTFEIAHDVVLVGQSAAYSPSGIWFAFTARPVDGSAGPDIYVWKVGDPLANRITNDHSSVFGSWSGETMVGSTITLATHGSGSAATTDIEPVSFLLDPATSIRTDVPQIGLAWRPAVDPSGRLAAYWTGTIRATVERGLAPDVGRLVIGDWGAAISVRTDGPIPTPLASDQAATRHETTIDAGHIDDWDARWDSTGTHLAVWIADAANPAIGQLSLYAVDSFDGKIDLKKPLLDSKPAIAGYAISDGQLVWAEPTSDGATTGGQIQLLAWTAEGVGQVGTVTGPVIVIR